MVADKFKFGDYIVLKKDAVVINSVTGKELPKRIVNESEIWAVDDYFPEAHLLNISRVINPYPGAYCSWVKEKYVKKKVKIERRR